MTLELPGYTLKREIGSGGMAAVYLAIQDSLDRRVALKVMSPALAADQTFTKRFLREAKTVAALSHQNIVSVYDVGVTDNHLHYFSMEFLANGDFADRIRRGTSQEELIRVLLAIANALGFAHDRGYVHRDVKPGNILFNATDTPVLTDFGIARAASNSTRMTGTGVSVGTSHYMSPEQARGKDVDGRSDLYSLGVVAFEALAGRTPFSGEDGFAIAYSHVFDPIPSLPPEVAEWQDFINTALSKRPDDRFQSAAEMVRALRELRAGGGAVVPTADELLVAGATTPIPSVRGHRPTLKQRLAVLVGIVRGVPGSWRYNLFRDLARVRERAVDLWRLGVDRAFPFLQPERRPIGGLVAAFLLIAVIAMLSWGEDEAEAPALADAGPQAGAPLAPEDAVPAGRVPSPAVGDTVAADPVEAAASDSAGLEQAAPAGGSSAEPSILNPGLQLDFDPDVSQREEPADTAAANGAVGTDPALPATDRQVAGEVDRERVSAAEGPAVDAGQPVEALGREDSEDLVAAGQAPEAGAIAAPGDADVGDADPDAGAGAPSEALASGERRPSGLQLPEADTAGGGDSDPRPGQEPTLEGAAGDIRTGTRGSAAAPSPEVAERLALAAADLEEDRLTTPSDQNAFDRYRAVLDLDPGNEAAKAGLAAIVERYFVLSRAATRRRDYGSAVTLIDRAEPVAALGDVSEQVVAAREDLAVRLRDDAEQALAGGDNDTALAALRAARMMLPDDSALADQIAELALRARAPRRFRDPLAGGGEGPEMVAVSLRPFELPLPGGGALGIGQDRDREGGERRLAVSSSEVTVGLFARFLAATGYFDSGRQGPCRKDESRWQGSRSRSWAEPGFNQGDDHPVVCVTWEDATALANWLSSETGLVYRLPTEAEWEFLRLEATPRGSVCESDNVGDIWLKAVESDLPAVDCEDGWAYTAPVTSLALDPLGLVGIVGNVREWTADCWNGRRERGSQDYAPALSGDCRKRVVKGGSWYQGAVLEPAAREGFGDDDAYNTVGFRLVRALD